MVLNAGLWAIGSVIIVSLIAFIGLFFISLREDLLNKVLLPLVSFAIGTLLGGAFLHLLPKAIKSGTKPFWFGMYALIGIVGFFILEKIIRWEHRHVLEHEEEEHEIKPYVWINLLGDGIHNFIDGVIIAGSYLVNIELGITTTLGVIFHESAQEVGDFAVLVKGGFSTKKALFFNFLSALTAVAGGLITLFLEFSQGGITGFLVPLAFSSFLYLSLSDLIHELHHHNKLNELTYQTLFIIFGIVVMTLLKFIHI